MHYERRNRNSHSRPPPPPQGGCFKHDFWKTGIFQHTVFFNFQKENTFTCVACGHKFDGVCVYNTAFPPFKKLVCVCKTMKVLGASSSGSSLAGTQSPVYVANGVGWGEPLWDNILSITACRRFQVQSPIKRSEVADDVKHALFPIPSSPPSCPAACQHGHCTAISLPLDELSVASSFGFQGSHPSLYRGCWHCNEEKTPKSHEDSFVPSSTPTSTHHTEFSRPRSLTLALDQGVRGWVC